MEPGYFTEVEEGSLVQHLKNIGGPPPGLHLQHVSRTAVSPVGFLLPLNSPLTRMFNQGITWLRQSGYIEKAVTEHVASFEDSESEPVTDLGLSHTGAVFVVFAVVLLGVAGLIVLEVLWKRQKRTENMAKMTKLLSHLRQNQYDY